MELFAVLSESGGQTRLDIAAASHFLNASCTDSAGATKPQLWSPIYGGSDDRALPEGSPCGALSFYTRLSYTAADRHLECLALVVVDTSVTV